MNAEIETLDRRRMRNLKWSVFGSATFVVLSVTRYFFRLRSLNSEPIGRAVLAGLILCLLILVLCAYDSARIGKKMKESPALREALQNELVLSLGVQSWKAAYIGAVSTTVFFAISWFFYPVNDPVMISLTSIVAGAACYQATFYARYRSA